MAERMIHREVSLVPVESDLPAEYLCLLGCGVMSGLGAVLSVADVRPGDTVAVVGCGHLGLWMVQAARLAGARQIIAVEPLAERRKLAGTLGATDLVDPGEGDPVEQVKALTGGRGTDVALEAGGTTAAMEESFRMARAGGVVVPTSMDQPDSTVTLSAIDYAISGKRVLSSQTGGGHVRRDVPRFAALLESGAVDATPIVSRHFALDEINDAIAAAQAKEVLTGVIRLG
jgi:Zn-dependent alcohol dehydrogenase